MFINLLYVSIVIHVFSAITWLGSLITLEFILIPSLINDSNAINGDLVKSVNKGYTSVAHIASAAILVTGLFQTFDIGYLNISRLLQTMIGNLIITKVFLYVVFVIISIKIGLVLNKIDSTKQREDLERLLKQTRKLLYLDLFVGMVIVIIAISLLINPGLSL